MSSARRSPLTVKRAERRQRALELRRRGASYRQIAAQLRVSVATVHDDVQATLSELPKGDAALHVAEQLGRLDELTAALMPVALTGDPRAAEACVKIEERRSRLLGLDQPTKSAVALITPDVERRVQLVAEIEGHTDSQLADGLFGALTETLRLALREDPERTLDALAKAGLVAGLAESLRLEQRHAHDGR